MTRAIQTGMSSENKNCISAETGIPVSLATSSDRSSMIEYVAVATGWDSHLISHCQAESNDAVCRKRNHDEKFQLLCRVVVAEDDDDDNNSSG